MNVFVKEDKEAMIGCTTWPRVKIGSNVQVGGNIGYIAEVKVGIDWIAGVEVEIG